MILLLLVPCDGGVTVRVDACRYPQVSAWRSILAANEFSEMQTTRKTSLNFTLLILLFFLRGVGLEYVATPQPTATDLTPGPTNPVLLFALVSLLWLGINLLQVVWNVAVYERYALHATCASAPSQLGANPAMRTGVAGGSPSRALNGLWTC